MMDIIIFAIILISILFFIGWAWEEPGGGITAVVVGIIVYWSGSHIAGIVIGIIGIAGYIHAKDNQKNRNKREVQSFHQNDLYELLRRCWNYNTCEFNWDIWIDQEDDVFYDDSDLKTKQIAIDEFKSMGKAQVRWINTELEIMMDPNCRDYGILQIKEKEASIVRKLHCMFNHFNGGSLGLSSSRLYDEVTQYRADIYDYIIHGNKQLTQEKLSSMIKRGEAICNMN
ncbi:hypothetical protein [Catenibacterium mitsuokai]|uniref:hypothetical protein n=1 Tax=Catenibacterium mitsuokai TaxID=100886 RepID=UPI003F8E56BC